LSGNQIDKVEILVGPFPVDASLMEHKGQRTLLLRPQQTFSSAVRHIRHLLPDLPLEAAERLVREQCPEFKDFDELLGANEPPAPRVEWPAEPVAVRDTVVPRRSARRRRAMLAAALLPALAASWAVGRYTDLVDPSSDAAAASVPDTAGVASSDPAGPFTDGKFEYFAGSSKIVCEPISELEAECTDADGMVMSTKAATGPDSTIFTFSYGSERIGLRIFYEAGYAATWARQDGSQELYPNMQRLGRYVLWGTDPSRIAEYADLLKEANRAAGPRPMGAAVPLPPRLAGLTLGTLGLDDTAVEQILARPASASADAPTLVAARMVLGLDHAPVLEHQGDGDDIVALAVGIGPAPVLKTPQPVPSAPPTAVLSPAPAPVTVPPSTVPTTPAPTAPVVTAPPTNPAPTAPVEPTVPESPTANPPAEKPTAPPVTEPPAPPVEETPAPPAAEAPRPVDPGPEDPGETDGGEALDPAPSAPAPPPELPDAGPVDDVDEDDLFLADSAWTVAA
jgi:hypothetical protein